MPWLRRAIHTAFAALPFGLRGSTLQGVATLTIAHAGIGVLFMALSLPLLWQKVPPNRLYGFRTRATLGDPRVWYPANRFAAKRMLLAGAVLVAAAIVLHFVPGLTRDARALGAFASFGAVLAVGFLQSHRYAKSLADPHRREAFSERP